MKLSLPETNAAEVNMVRKVLVLAVILVMGAVGCGGPASGGGGQPGQPREFDTPEQLMEAAEPVWQPTGETEKVRGVSFQRPAAWGVLAAEGGIGIVSPVDKYGDECAIYVLEPRPVASTEEGRLEQALQVASDLLLVDGGTLSDDFGSPTPLDRAFRGSTGSGWGYAGLTMRLSDPADNTFNVISMITHSESSAVPLVVIEPQGSTWDCVGYNGEFGLNVANVFYSLDMGNSQPDRSLEPKTVGKWFSSGGSVGNHYIFGANGQYIHAATIGGWVEITPGQWENQYATWSGDGSWVAVGAVLGMFPNERPASSHFARQFEFRNFDGHWQDTLCWIDAYNAEPYTYCTQRTE